MKFKQDNLPDSAKSEENDTRFSEKWRKMN